MSETKNTSHGPTGFIVVLPNTIIEIPLTSNLSWLPLFYALPPELLGKRPEYAALPRNINVLLSSPDAVKLIEDDLFLELVWDCYAWSIWQFLKVPLQNGTYRDIPGSWSNYSGDFPLWRLSYYIQHFFRDKFEHEMEFSFQRLFLMPPSMTVPWLDYQHFGNLVGNLTDMIVEEQKMQPAIDEIWRTRQVDDYSGKSLAKKDFMKSWTHVRSDSKIKVMLSLDEMMEKNDPVFSSDEFSTDVSDEAIQRISIEEFKNGLPDEDKLILRMRAEGKKLGEIAEAVGLKSPSAVTKRIDKLTEQFKATVN